MSEWNRYGEWNRTRMEPDADGTGTRGWNRDARMEPGRADGTGTGRFRSPERELGTAPVTMAGAAPARPSSYREAAPLQRVRGAQCGVGEAEQQQRRAVGAGVVQRL